MRPTRAANFEKCIFSRFLKGPPFFVDTLRGANCAYWTYRLACRTVDTLAGMNIQHSFTLVYAIDRTFFNACHILDIDARLTDYECHMDQPSLLLHAPSIRSRFG